MLEKQLELLRKIEYSFCDAIRNGINNNTTIYPKAYIQHNNSLALECDKRIEEFESFAKIFEQLCSQYNISKLPNTTAFYSHDDLSTNSKKISKFTFNISPEEFDSLLMKTSEAYRGYRHFRGAGSILLLANPYLEASKKDVICSFPVWVINDNLVVLRNSGCNASELISTQLTYLITQYLDSSCYQNSTKRYGHWGAEITELALGVSRDSLVTAAIKCFSNTEETIYIQDMEGFDVLPIRQESMSWLKPMDETNIPIYQLLGTASRDELVNLQSLEIPSEIYLSQLKEQVEEHLRHYEPGGNYAPNGIYYRPESGQDYTKVHEKLTSYLNNIQTLLSNISTSKQPEMSLQKDDKTTKGSSFAFFKPNSETQPLKNDPLPCKALSQKVV